jgi:hypothetical protein
MISDFEFEEGGRTFVCSVETPRHAGMPPWWWYTVALDNATRFAPFEAKAGDTKRSVQERIVKHYEEVLAIRARPVHVRPQWQRPARPPVAPPIPMPEAAGAVEAVTPE